MQMFDFLKFWKIQHGHNWLSFNFYFPWCPDNISVKAMKCFVNLQLLTTTAMALFWTMVRILGNAAKQQ